MADARVRAAPARLVTAGSGRVRPVDDAAEPFLVGVVVAPDDVPADHAGLLFVTGMIGPVEREVPQRRELRLDAVYQEEFVGATATALCAAERS
jgi:hypothetical protein